MVLFFLTAIGSAALLSGHVFDHSGLWAARLLALTLKGPVRAVCDLLQLARLPTTGGHTARSIWLHLALPIGGGGLGLLADLATDAIKLDMHLIRNIDASLRRQMIVKSMVSLSRDLGLTGEISVDPYEQSNANAGAEPFDDGRLAAAFGGQEGIRRMTDRTVELSETDPRIAENFYAHDMVRLKRTLFEQFCYLLGAGCDYSGRDMRSAHDGMGVRKADLNALIENLQQAMREAEVPFGAQNRLLSKLAPMSGDVVER